MNIPKLFKFINILALLQPNFNNNKYNQNLDIMPTTKKKFLRPLSPKNDKMIKQSRRPQTYTKDDIEAQREIVISESKHLKNSTNRAMTDSGQVAVESSVDLSPRTKCTHNAFPNVMNDYMRKNQQLYIRRKEIESKYNSLQTNMIHKKRIKPRTMQQEQPQTLITQPPEHRNSQNSENLEKAIQVLFTMTPRSKRPKRSKKDTEKIIDEYSEIEAEPIEMNATKEKMPSKVNTRWTFDEPISFSKGSAECYKKLIEIKEVVQKKAIPPRSKVDTRWPFDVPSMTKSTTKCYTQLLGIEDAAKKLERLQTEVRIHIASQPVKVTASTSTTNFPRYLMSVLQGNNFTAIII